MQITETSTNSPKLSLRILSHNTRYATTSPFPNEKPWAERKQLILNELAYNTRTCPGYDGSQSLEQPGLH